ncbi:MAG: DUF951 domain-containing protein [Anaerolineae bacterium]|nr:DUF951 domain-containing protein [Anaerolineae bacterium]
MATEAGSSLKPLEIAVDDILQLRKKHPCGSDRWRVYRVGADIGIRCEGCGRRVLLPRQKLVRRIKAILPR